MNFSAYIPLTFQCGDNFTGNMNGLEVNGKIIAILPSQLDAVSFVVQDNDV